MILLAGLFDYGTCIGLPEAVSLKRRLRTVDCRLHSPLIPSADQKNRGF